MNTWNVLAIICATLAVAGQIATEMTRHRLRREARELRAEIARLIHPSAQQRP